MAAVTACVAEVPPLFEALIAQDQGGIERAKNIIFAKEHEADTIKNGLRAHLPKSMFLPVDRRDLLELLGMQDSIADTAQDIAGLLVERDMQVPPGMADDLRMLVARCVDAVNQAGLVIAQLDELVETGFRGREAEAVAAMIEKLNLIEDDTDRLGMALARALFDREDSLNPVSVIFWYRLIEWIGDLADFAEKVGDRLRLLIAR